MADLATTQDPTGPCHSSCNDSMSWVVLPGLRTTLTLSKIRRRGI